jgi:hypothetical protein
MPNGQTVLVQTLPLRPAAGPERGARDEFERALSLATLECAARGDPILAHKAVGGVERTMVWLLPLSELARPKIRTPEELLGLGIGILTQLAERHQRGLTAPLLSERSITAHGRIVGAQIFACGRWIAEEVEPIRLAPEERVKSRALPSGDLFRLGQLLSELARQFALPPEISRLVHPDPEQRPTAAQALEQFDAAFARNARAPSPPKKESHPVEELLFEAPQVTETEEPEAGFEEPLPAYGHRAWLAPASLALAGLFAGALLSLLPG